MRPYPAPDEGTLTLRPPQAAEAPALAQLMVDAYRSTIDYDGETLADAAAEVNAYLAGDRGGPPWLALSRVALVDGLVVGACLVSEWRERRSALIAYLMTRPEWKNRRVGRQLLLAALAALADSGHTDVRAVITEGNLPSERLFLHAGFQRVPPP